MTDWSKAIEVCVSGVLGVYLVMLLLMLLTQLSTRIIDVIEKSWNKSPAPAPEPKEVVPAGGNSNV